MKNVSKEKSDKTLRNVLGLAAKITTSNAMVRYKYQGNHEKGGDGSWIYQLNIGNIMQLNPINEDEWIKLEVHA